MSEQTEPEITGPAGMNEEMARSILSGSIRGDGGLYSLDSGESGKFEWYLNWSGGLEARMDGSFTPDDLEAIAWWMRNKTVWRRSPLRTKMEP